LDASAVLAYLQQEKGQESVEAVLDAGPCFITAVNLCEVLGKLCEKGMPPPEAEAVIDDLGLMVVSFDEKLAALAAFMKPRTRSIGASLGDCACLALGEFIAAEETEAAVVTAERSWTKLKWPFKVVRIR
jgi:PIN domain nuclease of toxin-antitoxin system